MSDIELRDGTLVVDREPNQLDTERATTVMDLSPLRWFVQMDS